MKKQCLTLALLVICYNVAASELASVAAGGVLATALACNVVVPGMPTETKIPVSKAEIVAGATSVVAGAASVACVHAESHDVAAAFGVISLLAAYKKYSFVRMRAATAQQTELTGLRQQIEDAATARSVLDAHNAELQGLLERAAVARQYAESSYNDDLARLRAQVRRDATERKALTVDRDMEFARLAAQTLQLETSNAQLKQQIDHAATAQSVLDARNAELRAQLDSAAAACEDLRKRNFRESVRTTARRLQLEKTNAQLIAQVASLVAPRDVATQECGTQSAPCVAMVVSGRSASFQNSQRSTPRSPLAAAAAAACSEPMSGCVTTPSPALINAANVDQALIGWLAELESL